MALSAAQPDADRPALLERQGETGTRVELAGSWTMQGLIPRLAELTPLLDRLEHQPATWDLSAVQAIDHMGAALLWRAWGRRRTEQLVLRPEHDALFRRLGAAEPTPQTGARPALPTIVTALGRAVLRSLGHVSDVLTILGAFVIDLLRLCARPATIPWR